MQLRLVEIVLPNSSTERLTDVLDEHKVVGGWSDPLNDDLVRFQVLVEAERSEELLDVLESRFSSLQEFRVVLLPVEATVPRVPDEKEPQPEEKEKPAGRVSRQELYADVAQGAQVSRV
ncbi:MAG: hypothetical protein ISR77_35740 [Pirellulaceae bacterium]|nr:hypothetical protein [Pirellulaceae bacterium]